MSKDVLKLINIYDEKELSWGLEDKALDLIFVKDDNYTGAVTYAEYAEYVDKYKESNEKVSQKQITKYVIGLLLLSIGIYVAKNLV